MIVKMHHCAIATVDLDRMIDFYVSILGFALVSQQAWDVGSPRYDAITQLKDSSARLAMLRLGSTCLELFEYASPVPKPGDPDRPVSDAGITHMAFVVDDIDAEYARMVKAGVRFHCAPNAQGALRATYGRDPEGNVFELLEIVDPAHPFAEAVTLCLWCQAAISLRRRRRHADDSATSIRPGSREIAAHGCDPPATG